MTTRYDTIGFGYAATRRQDPRLFARIVAVVPVPRDTPDWSLVSFWAHPHRLLDPAARAATSGTARMPAEVLDRAIAALTEDLRNGQWQRKNGDLNELDEFDSGLRLIIARAKPA